MTKYPLTGADEATTTLLAFPHSTPSNSIGSSHAVAMTHLRIASDPDNANSARPAIRIQGTKGELQVDGPAFRPPRYRFIPKLKDGEKGGEVKDVEFEIPGGGMFWEADEAARCLRDGKLESEGLPLEESVVIMEVMDEVRRQGELVYPEKIESTEYPLQL
jgi:predicted dehydrogenase